MTARILTNDDLRHIEALHAAATPPLMQRAGTAAAAVAREMLVHGGTPLIVAGPGNNGGDAFVVFPALRVMHTGDAFHTRDLPIMDKNNGGSGVQYSATLARAAQVKNVDTIINGHNPTTTTVADLKTQSEFIADFVKFVQDAKRGGRTVDDVVNTWKTPAKYTGYATPNPARVRADAQVIWDETK